MKINKFFIVTLILIIGNTQNLSSQEAKDFLEHSIIVPKNTPLFIEFIDSTMVKYSLGLNHEGKPYFTEIKDTLFQSRQGLNVFIKAYNPLSYSYASELDVKLDPINQKASEALGEIINVINDIQKNSQGMQMYSSNCFGAIQNNLLEIQEILEDDKKKEIISIFKSLKTTSFESEITVRNSLSSVNPKIESIEEHFDQIPVLVKELQQNIKDYICDNDGDGVEDNPNEAFQLKLLLALVIKDINTTYLNQRKRAENIIKIRDLVVAAKERADKNPYSGDEGWYYFDKEISVDEDEISNFSFSFKRDGFKLNEDEEVIEITPKTISKKTLTVRKFQRFIPEVSIGTAYTFFDYYSYGTDTDSLGNQIVGVPNQESLKNLKISTMLNLVYQIENSNLHPFYQLGAGINSEIPSILTGFGLRTNFGGLKRIAISSGIAMTWVKELNELEVGNPVSGTSEIEDDLKYEFSWPPKAYIGIQYNF